MTKRELVYSIASATGLSMKTARQGLEAVLDGLKESLQVGEKVKVVGFGTFATAQRARRTAINLRTMERVTVPPRRVVTFSPGTPLKAKVQRHLRRPEI